MVNEEVAKIFETMARVLAFKGQDRFRIMAYERAAVSLRDLDEDLAAIAEAGHLKEIPGIGDDLAEMIEEYVKTHTIRRYERECRGTLLAAASGALEQLRGLNVFLPAGKPAAANNGGATPQAYSRQASGSHLANFSRNSALSPAPSSSTCLDFDP